VVHSFRITVKSISVSLIPSATVGTRGNSPILDESTAESRVIGSFLDNSARPKLMTCGMNYETVRRNGRTACEFRRYVMSNGIDTIDYIDKRKSGSNSK